MNLNSSTLLDSMDRIGVGFAYKNGSHAGMNIKNQCLLWWTAHTCSGATLLAKLFFLLNLQTFLCFFIVVDDLRVLAHDFNRCIFRHISVLKPCNNFRSSLI
jgi:hypothetical protein